jgi:hypothetical protein
LRKEDGVGAGVFGVEGWVEGGAHVVYVYLDVSWGLAFSDCKRG